MPKVFMKLRRLKHSPMAINPWKNQLYFGEHRVLKPTGSLYLHCDPTSSHYLKILLDGIFSVKNFRNEISWKRTHAHSGSNKYGPIHDVIFFYTKSETYQWHPIKVPYTESYIQNFFRFTDDTGRRYRATILTGSGIRHGLSGQPWRGIDPTAVGRHWAIPGFIRAQLNLTNNATVHEVLDELDQQHRILWPNKPGGTPSFKQYLDDIQGVNLQDIWTDIPPLSAQSAERLGYPTQKPEALLERIITASSQPGNLILVPFCGCGTAVAVAERLQR